MSSLNIHPKKCDTGTIGAVKQLQFAVRILPVSCVNNNLTNHCSTTHFTEERNFRTSPMKFTLRKLFPTLNSNYKQKISRYIERSTAHERAVVEESMNKDRKLDNSSWRRGNIIRKNVTCCNFPKKIPWHRHRN